MKYIEVYQDNKYYVVKNILDNNLVNLNCISVPDNICLLIQEAMTEISDDKEVLIPIKDKYDDLTKTEIITRFKTLNMTKNMLLIKVKQMVRNKYNMLANISNVLTVNSKLYTMLFNKESFDYTDSTSYVSELNNFVNQLTQFIADYSKVNELMDNIETAISLDQLDSLEQQIKTLLE